MQELLRIEKKDGKLPIRLKEPVGSIVDFLYELYEKETVVEYKLVFRHVFTEMCNLRDGNVTPEKVCDIVNKVPLQETIPSA